MNRFDVVLIKEMPVNARFYFVGDRKKDVYEKINSTEIRSMINHKHVEKFKIDKQGVFLRIAK